MSCEIRKNIHLPKLHEKVLFLVVFVCHSVHRGVPMATTLTCSNVFTCGQPSGKGMPLVHVVPLPLPYGPSTERPSSGLFEITCIGVMTQSLPLPDLLLVVLVHSQLVQVVPIRLRQRLFPRSSPDPVAFLSLHQLFSFRRILLLSQKSKAPEGNKKNGPDNQVLTSVFYKRCRTYRSNCRNVKA